MPKRACCVDSPRWVQSVQVILKPYLNDCIAFFRRSGRVYETRQMPKSGFSVDLDLQFIMTICQLEMV